jgi:hypothetical protein
MESSVDRQQLANTGAAALIGFLSIIHVIIALL